MRQKGRYNDPVSASPQEEFQVVTHGHIMELQQDFYTEADTVKGSSCEMVGALFQCRNLREITCFDDRM